MNLKSRRGAAWLLLCAGILVSPLTLAAGESVGAVVDTHDATQNAARQSQRRVSALDDETQSLLNEYQRLLQQADYQRAWNQELLLREEEQQQELVQLQRQIADAQITRQRILPLLRQMADTLGKFIVLDLPFEREERLAVIERLNDVLTSPSTPVTEKYRRVMEAYQAENDYNYDLQTWRGQLEWEGKQLSVVFLRLGRMSLYFQTPDGQQSGIWDKATDQWHALPSSSNRSIARAMRVADKTLAPELLNLPLHAVPASNLDDSHQGVN